MRTLWDNKWEKMKNNERSHSNLDRVSRAVFNYINSNLPLNTKKIIETGCGTGRICYAIAEQNIHAEVLGTDVSQDSIDLCNKSLDGSIFPNLSFEVMDIYSIKFPDETFDVTFNEGVLQHIPDDLKGLKEMVRVTKPGGLVFISVTNAWNLPHTIYKFLKGKRYEHYPEKYYGRFALTKLMKNAGLKDIYIYGVQPGYGMQRIEGYLPLLGPIIAQLMYLAAWLIDPISNNLFSNFFGIQIVAKGRK